ncbi:forkhead box protein N [Mytilus galloprovincialis]|uniref:Forkhead box protein N n=1 Tax=Mytilus galloprovincialis TaxID=29158 RepID=A0A8B6BNK3_MYTGA|nr:forkhead box protein N [Mytilus galloprovincialis]
MMASMPYPNVNDMDFLDSVSLDNDLQKEMEKILQGSDKFTFDNYLSSGTGTESSNHGFNFDTSATIDEWIQNFQCEDVTKFNQNLLDNSFEIENNNPNLLVNPQNVLQQTFVRPFRRVAQPEAVTVKVEATEDDVVVQQVQNAHFQHPSTQSDNVRSFVKIQPAGSQRNFTLSHSNVNINNNTITHVQNFKQQEGSPSQRSPVLVKHLHNGISTTQPNNFSYSSSSGQNIPNVPNSSDIVDKVFPKPVYSYSCLISMALKNSKNGSLPVSEIYNFMITHFPYFKTAPDGWKNSVRHNLSLNKCFAKVDTPKLNGNAKKGCLWALNPEKIEKMEDEIAKHRKKDLEAIKLSMSMPGMYYTHKHRKKDLEAIKLSMSMPEKLELIEAGKAGPVGGDPPSPRCSTPHTPKETAEYLINDLPTIDSGMQMDHSLTDISLQNGLWDDSGEINVVDLPMTTPTLSNGHVTLSASTATIPVKISLANGAVYQGNFACTASPMTSGNSSQIPSYVLSAQI